MTKLATTLASAAGNASATTKANEIPEPVRHFDDLPDSALVTIRTTEIMLGRSRASIYRDFQSGHLTLRKVGDSSRVTVGEIRKRAAA